MKFVISGYYGFNNSGDDALLLSIINDIKSIDEEAQITVLSNSPKDTKRVYGVNAVNRYNIFTVVKAISGCDLVISGGGTLIQDATSTKSLMYYLAVINIAKMLRRKVMMYANGIGPLTSFKNIESTRKVLDKVDLITLRDENSQKELEKIGITGPEVRLTADPAFMVEPNESGKSILENYGVPKDMALMCVSVRKWKNNPDNFEEEMAAFCDYAYEKYGLFTVFLPMQPKLDFEIASRIKSAMKNRSVVIGSSYPIESMLSLMEQMTICVGMRLHTLIYAASSAIPTIGIVYDPKINGFMEYMGQKYFTFLEEASAQQMKELLDEVSAKYEDVCLDMKYNIRKLRSKAAENAELMKKLLEGEAF